MEERLRHCKAYLASIKDANWDEFELPNALGLDGCFANGLLNSRYPAEEVDRYVLPPPSSAGEPTPPEAESKPSRSAHAQACNTKCRRIAKRIWERQPDFTITAMIHHSEIAHQARKPDGTAYSEMTIRNWIRDLCPNPKPGRRAAVSLSRTIRT